jgi:hypothetical protein
MVYWFALSLERLARVRAAVVQEQHGWPLILVLFTSFGELSQEDLGHPGIEDLGVDEPFGLVPYDDFFVCLSQEEQIPVHGLPRNDDHGF